ncbi:DUF5050 domain-containing protein [Paenibacillus ginsengarvi]|nr:DUF5050 domain-containing protein [Paenibacillus ginsengarvi]
MRRSVLAAVMAVPLLLLGSVPGFAAVPERAEAALPAFPVFLNGTPVDNVHSLYPLLVYKGITYFPMTWEYAQALGLATSWNEQTGLAIDKQAQSEAWTQALKPEPNVISGEAARFAEFPVRVNGKSIDNNKEPYPLLLFRNITYFPMTWRFTHDEFGWETSWDPVNGFRVVTAQQEGGSQPATESDNFNLNSSGQLAVAGDWMYYNPNNSYGHNYLYKMKLDGSGKTKLTDDNAESIHVVGDWVYYTSRDKGANVQQGIYKVRTDGTERTKISDAPASRITVDGDWIYYVDQELTRQQQHTNFYTTLGIKKIKTDGNGETSLYQGNATDSNRGAVDHSIHVLKDWIYFMQPGDGEHPAVLNKIRKDGSQLTPLVSANFNSFVIVDGWLYYGENNQLRKMSLEGGDPSITLRNFELDRENAVNFESLHYYDGWLYYVKGAFGIAGAANIEKIRIDGSDPTRVIEGVRAVRLFFAGDKLLFTGGWMGESPLYEVTADGGIHSLREE